MAYVAYKAMSVPVPVAGVLIVSSSKNVINGMTLLMEMRGWMS